MYLVPKYDFGVGHYCPSARSGPSTFLRGQWDTVVPLSILTKKRYFYEKRNSSQGGESSFIEHTPSVTQNWSKHTLDRLE